VTALPPAPTLILGGFLITPEAYWPMATAIAAQTGQPVQVVPTTRLEWLRTGGRPGWRRLLDRSHDLLLALAAESPVGRVNLVGHSSGGVMLRLLLGDHPFAGRVYADRIRVQSLVTLGSPHQAVRGTALRREVAALYPGAPYARELAYLAVAGAIESSELRPRVRPLVQRSYRAINNDPASRGDGLVPVSSALLDGAEPLVLEGVGHGGWFAERWYGSPEVLPRWVDRLGPP
jgi:pimeloyl-ACP methyl ester carboxylesterase